MISFRKLKDIDEDYLLMMEWLNNSDIRQWYGYDDFLQPPDFNDIRRKYKKKVLNATDTNPNIILINNIPVGYIQYYETDEYLHEENVYGIDLFIGNDDYRGKGYGIKILKQIIKDIFLNSNIRKIIVDPHIENKRAIQCYLNTGFQEFKQIEDQLIMIINR